MGRIKLWQRVISAVLVCTFTATTVISSAPLNRDTLRKEGGIVVERDEISRSRSLSNRGKGFGGVRRWFVAGIFGFWMLGGLGFGRGVRVAYSQTPQVGIGYTEVQKKNILEGFMSLWPWQRKEAIEKAVRMGRPAVHMLIAMLNDKWEWVRRSAVEALGRIGDERAVEPLGKLLGDKSIEVQKVVCEALGRIGSKRAVEILSWVAKAGERDKEVRIISIKGAFNLGNKAIIKEVASGLYGKDEVFNEEFIESLGKDFGVVGIDVLYELFKRGNKEISGMAFDTLEDADHPRAKGYLSKYRKEQEEAERQRKDREAREEAERKRKEEERRKAKILKMEEEWRRAEEEQKVGEVKGKGTISQTIESITDGISELYRKLTEKKGWEKEIDGYVERARREDAEELVKRINNNQYGDTWDYIGEALEKVVYSRARLYYLLYKGEIKEASRQIRGMSTPSKNLPAESFISESLSSENPRIRESAVKVIGKGGFSINMLEGSLIECLNDEDEDVRDALEELLIDKEEKGVDVLVRALESKEKAVEILERFDVPRAKLYYLLYEGNVDTIVKGEDVGFFKGLMNERKKKGIGDREWRIKELVNALEHLNLEIRITAAKSLGKIGEPKTVGELFRVFNSTKERSLKKAIIQAIGDMSGTSAISPLIEIVENGEDEFVRPAIVLLGKMDNVRARDYCKRYKEKKRRLEEEKKRAEEAKRKRKRELEEERKKLKEEKRRDELIGDLNRRSDYTRRAAAIDMGKFKEKRFVEPLIERLDDRSNRVREEVIRALGEIGDDRAVPVLIEILLDGEISDQEKAAVALEKIGDSRSKIWIDLYRGRIDNAGKDIEICREALKYKNREIKKSAIRMLGKIGGGDARILLFGIKGYFEKEAIEALGEIQGDETVEILATKFKNPNNKSQKESAAKTLNKLGWKPVDLHNLEKIDYYFINQNWEMLERLSSKSPDNLNRLWNKRRDKNVRKRLVRILKKIDSEKFIEVVNEIGHSNFSSSVLNVAAVKALGRMGKKSIPMLVKFMRDSKGKIASAAAKELQRLKWQPVTEEEKINYYIFTETWIAITRLKILNIRPLLKRKAYIPKKVFVEVLTNAGSPEAIEALIAGKEEYYSSDIMEVMAIVKVLRKVEDRERIGSVIKYLLSKILKTKSGTELLIGASLLMEELMDDSCTVRQWIKEVLVEEDEYAVEPLIRELKSKDEQRVAVALEILGRMSNPKAKRVYMLSRFVKIGLPSMWDAFKKYGFIFFFIPLISGGLWGILTFIKEKRKEEEMSLSKRETGAIVKKGGGAIPVTVGWITIKANRKFRVESVRGGSLVDEKGIDNLKWVLKRLYDTGYWPLLFKLERIRMVKGNDRLVHLDTVSSSQLVLDIDVFKNKWILLMEMEHDLTHLVRMTQQRGPPGIEEIIAIRQEIRCFLSLESRHQKKVLSLLKSDKDIDDKEFYKLLEYAKYHGADNITDRIVKYINAAYDRKVVDSLRGLSIGQIENLIDKYENYVVSDGKIELSLWERIRSDTAIREITNRYKIELCVAELMVILHRRIEKECRSGKIGKDESNNKGYRFTLRDLRKWAEFIRYYGSEQGTAKAFVKGAYYVYGDRMETKRDRERIVELVKGVDISILVPSEDTDKDIFSQKEIKITEADWSGGRYIVEGDGEIYLYRGDYEVRILDAAVKVNNKSSSYIPSKDKAVLMPVAKTLRDMEKIAQAVALNNPLLLVGETGVGKTALVRYLAYLTNNGLKRFNLNGQTDKLEFIGGYKPVSDEGDGEMKFEWYDGILIEAMRSGDWLLLDEMNLAEPEVIERIRYLLEKDGYLVLSEHRSERWVSASVYDRMKAAGEDVEAQNIYRIHPDFRLFAAMNPLEYEGRKEMSEALMNKFTIKHIKEIDDRDAVWILSLRYGFEKYGLEKEFKKEILKKIVIFHRKMCRLSGKEGVFGKREGIVYYYTIRHLFRFCDRIEERMRKRWSLVRMSLEKAEIGKVMWLEAREVYGDNLRSKEDRQIFEKVVSDIFGSYVEKKDWSIEIDRIWGQVSFNEVELDINPAAGLMVPGPEAELKEVVTTRRYLRGLARSIKMNEKVLLVGPTGASKTSLVRYLAHLTRNNFIRVNLDVQTDTSELIGKYIPKEGTKGGVEWIDGVLVEALKKGYWILLDEINLAEPEILERINSLLDDDGYLVITEHHNEKVKSHPNFRFFAAMNPESVIGRNRLSRAMMNKFAEKWISGEMADEEMDKIISFYLTTPFVSDAEPIPEEFVKPMAEEMRGLHRRTMAMIASGEIGSGRISRGSSSEYNFSLRDIKDWAKFIRELVYNMGVMIIEGVIEGENSKIFGLQKRLEEGRDKEEMDEEEKEEILGEIKERRAKIQVFQNYKADKEKVRSVGLTRALIEGSLYIYRDRLESKGDKVRFAERAVKAIAQERLGGEIVDISKLDVLEEEGKGVKEMLDQKVGEDDSEEMSERDMEIAEIRQKFDGLTSSFKEVKEGIAAIRNYITREDGIRVADGVRGFALLPVSTAEVLIRICIFSSQKDIVRAAVEVAGHLEMEQFTPRLIELLDDDDRKIRITAALVLESFGWTPLKEKIERMRRNPDKLPFWRSINILLGRKESDKKIGDYLKLFDFLKEPFNIVSVIVVSVAFSVAAVPSLFTYVNYWPEGWFVFGLSYTGMSLISSIGIVAIIAAVFRVFYNVVYYPQYSLLHQRYKRLALSIKDFYAFLKSPDKEGIMKSGIEKNKERKPLFERVESNAFRIVSSLVGSIVVFSLLFYALRQEVLLMDLSLIHWGASSPLNMGILCGTAGLAGGAFYWFVSGGFLVLVEAVKEMVYQPLMYNLNRPKIGTKAYRMNLSVYNGNIIQKFEDYRDELKRTAESTANKEEQRPPFERVMKDDKIRQKEGYVEIDDIRLPVYKEERNGGFVPSADRATLINTVSTVRNIKKVALSILFDDPLLLIGETGVGKTSLIRYIAFLTHRDFRRFNLSGQTDKTEFIGGYKPDKEGRFGWVDGILIEAMREGAILVLDEINLAESQVIERINSLLDDDKYLRLTEYNNVVWLDSERYDERLKEFWGDREEATEERKREIFGKEKNIFRIHPDFRLFATMNPAEYAGRQILSPALMNRFRVKWIDKIYFDEEGAILYEKLGKKELTVELLWEMVWSHNDLQQLVQSRIIGVGERDPYHFTLRDLLRLVSRIIGRLEEITEELLPADKLDIAAQEMLEVYGDRMRSDDRGNFYLLMNKDKDLAPLTLDRNFRIDIEKDRIKFGEVVLEKNEESGEYIPSEESMLISTPITNRYLKRLAKAVKMNEKVLLVGPTGSAKTSLVRYLAYLTNNDFVRMNLDAQTDTSELIGQFIPVEGKKVEFKWQDGILVRALREGHWILLDELNLAEPDILERINSLLDDDGYLVVTENENELVRPHPNFRLFAAMNPERYAGRNRLSLAMRNKFTEIWVPGSVVSKQEYKEYKKHMESETEFVMENRYREEELLSIVKWYLKPEIKDRELIAKAMVSLHLEVTRLKESGAFQEEGLEPQFSMRELKAFARYINTFSDNLGIHKAFVKGVLYIYYDRLASKEGKEKLEGILKGIKEIAHINRYLKELLHREIRGIEEIVVPINIGNLPENVDMVLTLSALRNLEKIYQAVVLNEPLLLVGETGVGKTSMIRYLSCITGNIFRRFNLSSQTEKMDFIGGYQPDDKGAFRWNDGILIEAMKRGEWLVLDEINLAPPQVIERLNSLLDDDGYIVVSEHSNEKIIPHPEFRLFATMNPTEYAGRQVFSPALMNRFRVKWIDEVPKEELFEILKERYGRIFRERFLNDILKVHFELCNMDKEKMKRRYSIYTIRHLLRLMERIKYGLSLWGKRSSIEQLAAIEAWEVYGEGISDDVGNMARFKEEMKEKIEHSLGCSVEDDSLEIVQREKAVYFGNVKLTRNNSREVYVFGSPLYTGRSTKIYLKKLAKAVLMNERVLLVGETGGGKTSIVRYLADLTNNNFAALDLDGQTDTTQLIGQFIPVEGANRYRWEDGLLVKAMKNGWWLLLDEINLAEPEILERINSLLDDDRSLVVSEHKGEKVVSHPDFRLFAAMNPEHYAGRKELSIAMLNKFTQIWVSSEFPEEEEIAIAKNYLRGQGVTLSFLGTGMLVDFLSHLRHSLTSSNSVSLPPESKRKEEKGEGSRTPMDIGRTWWMNRKLSRIELIAKIYGRDFDLKVKPGSMWAIDYKTDPPIVLFPENDLRDRGIESIIGLAMHEGGHRDISWLNSFFQKDENRRFLFNAIEDARVDGWTMKKFAGTKKYLQKTYKETSSNIDKPFVDTEILPHIQYGLGVIHHQFYGKEHPGIKNEKVLEVLQRTRMDAQRVCNILAGTAIIKREEAADKFSIAFFGYKEERYTLPLIDASLSIMRGGIIDIYRKDKDKFIITTFKGQEEIILAEGEDVCIVTNVRPSAEEKRYAAEEAARIIKAKILPVYLELVKDSTNVAAKGEGGKGKKSPDESVKEASKEMADELQGKIPVEQDEEESVKKKEMSYKKDAGSSQQKASKRDETSKGQNNLEEDLPKDEDVSNVSLNGFDEEPAEKDEDFSGVQSDMKEDEKQERAPIYRKSRVESKEELTVEEMRRFKERSKKIGKSLKEHMTEYERYYTNVAFLIDRLFGILDNELHKDKKFKYKGHFGTGPRLDIRKAMSMEITGDTDIWLRKVRPTKRSFKFALVLDESGSMGGGRSQVSKDALESLVLFMEVLSRLDIDFSLIGFSDSSSVHKAFEEKFRYKDKDKLISEIYSYMARGGGTNDADAVKLSIEQLDNEMSDSKIVIVITDGWGNGPESVRGIINKARERKIEVIGIGIGSGMSYVRKVYEPRVVVDDIKELPEVLARVLIDIIVYGRHTPVSKAEDEYGERYENLMDTYRRIYRKELSVLSEAL